MSERKPQRDEPGASELRRASETSPKRIRSDERGTTAVFSAIRYFAGPLPPPAILTGYNEALPGLANRIVTVAKEEAKHRRGIERDCLNRDTTLQLRGQAFGFTIAPFTFAVAAVLIWMDKPLYGLSAVLAAVGGLSGLFLWTKSKSASGPRDRGPRHDTRKS